MVGFIKRFSRGLRKKRNKGPFRAVKTANKNLLLTNRVPVIENGKKRLQQRAAPTTLSQTNALQRAAAVKNPVRARIIEARLRRNVGLSGGSIIGGTGGLNLNKRRKNRIQKSIVVK